MFTIVCDYLFIVNTNPVEAYLLDAQMRAALQYSTLHHKAAKEDLHHGGMSNDPFSAKYLTNINR